MWHRMLSSPSAGTALILATTLAPAAWAQDPGTPSKTSAVQRLTHDSTTRPTASGRIRDLRCRGKPGIDIRVYQESSPRTPKLVTMMLRYDRPKETRSVGQAGMGTVDYGMSLQLIPGSCTWRYADSRGIPIEPGVVYFDIPRDAQGWTRSGARDTTIDVAMNFADVGSITRYLSDSTRYWGFYVDDVSNVSISFGPRGRPAPPIAFGAGPRDTTAGATTRAVAHGSADSPTIRPTTVRTSTAGDKVSGSLRDKPPVTSPGTGTLPNGPARHDAATRTPAPVSSPATTPSSNAAAVGTRRLSNVRIGPGPKGVIITFDVAIAGVFNRSSSVVAHIGTEPPAWDPKTRSWSYDWLQTLFSADVRELGGSSFEAVPTRRLEVGRRYHYLIELRGTPPEQRTGSFTAEALNPFRKPSP